MKQAILIGVLLVACGDNKRSVVAYREAVENARVTMRDMATVAEATMPNGRALTAELVPGAAAVYAYGTLGDGSFHDIRIDTVDGAIVANRPAGARTDDCAGSISLVEALGVAEAQVVGGTAIAAVPDDDVACAREIQVLGVENVMEVKVGGGGEVLEMEVSDDYDSDSDSDSDSGSGSGSDD